MAIDGDARVTYKRALKSCASGAHWILEFMAYHKQAKKRIRQTARHNAVNSSRVSRMRTFIKNVETAIDGADKDAAQAALKAAQPEIMRSVNKGLIHRNKASRKISRLAARVNAI